MPRRPDGEQYDEKIGEHIDRTSDDQDHVSVYAMAPVERIPDLLYGMAFEQDCEEDANVYYQVAPDQRVTCPVDRARSPRREDAYQLKE